MRLRTVSTTLGSSHGREIPAAPPTWSYTRAVSIGAPRSAVWPWLLQLGQGRGGFYSYARLENLAGCTIHDVPQSQPELQRLQIGAVVRMHTNGFGPQVMALEEERSLVLGGPADAAGARAVWSFQLFDGPDGTTRLVEHGRNAPGEGAFVKGGYGTYLTDPIGFVMGRKMLRAIGQLADTTRRNVPGRLRHALSVTLDALFFRRSADRSRDSDVGK